VGGAETDGEKGGPAGLSRTAEEPGQSVNVDLCFVPTTHDAVGRLPAVSGSSGRLVLCGRRLGAPETPGAPTWPGQVFEDADLDYATAMHAFVAASAPCVGLLNPDEERRRQHAASGEGAALRALRRDERMLAQRRGAVYQRRKQEDAAWRALCQDRCGRTKPVRGQRTRAEWVAYQAQEAQWRALWAERHALLQRRRAEDEVWRAERRRLRAQLASPPQPHKMSWIAILVLTDNCTRQCLGLSLFGAGPKITAALVVDALRALLPADLQFLISDRGTHFTAQTVARFADEHGFVHVFVARHRPESNGIAERFVRTLKEWLAAQTWSGAPALLPLLDCFRTEYNMRPHQGLGIPGLSPQEFAQRIWLL
jgi:transposase InsO family protein